MTGRPPEGEPRRYRKRPVEILAVQWLGGSEQQVWLCKWIGEDYEDMAPNGDLFINTLEGVMRASVGDWIVKGIKGEFYPVKPDIFEATYDEI